MNEIEPELHLPQIREVLASAGLHDCEVLIVESVQGWARAVGLREDNPSRVAMAAVRRAAAQPTIVLAKRITEGMQRAVIGGIELRGFIEDAERLSDPGAFLEHLVLHEAHHLLADGPSESDCDRWAFDHMRGSIPAW